MISLKKKGTGRNALVKVTIRGRSTTTVLARRGDVLLDVLRKAGAVVFAPCGGKGICKKCRVEIAEEGAPFACKHLLRRDVEVVLPTHGRARIVESARGKPRAVEPCTGIDATCTRGRITVSYKGRRICTFQGKPRDAQDRFGLAIDIGTTTVVVYLEDLASGSTVGTKSFVNPQTAYGYDVIARIQYTVEHRRGLRVLRGSLLSGINEAVRHLRKETGVGHGAIYTAAIAGNPTMLHIFLGKDPFPISHAPYTPVFTIAHDTTGKACGLRMNPRGVVRVLPSVSGYIGADVTAGIASTPMTDSKKFSLYLDIGTNGEMAVGNREVLYCCSTAAGPAFEGAALECGIGGIEGAICSFADGRYATIGNCPPAGICGSGIVDCVAWLLAKGIIDRSGYMETNYVLEKSERTAAGRDIVITPSDVRKIQLAKAATRAGIRILLKGAGIKIDAIGTLYLAGAFGTFMNVKSAASIGMIPLELQNRVVSIGNAAGTGARLALRSVVFEDSVRKIAAMARYLELSGREDFSEEYISSMGF
jgi:uncharacterized 2Fe-2S/4Fe-4S cluster protein (DUF4445 family)